MAHNMTARLAAAGAFPYFGLLKMFPRSNSIFDIIFKAKYPPKSKGIDFRAMLRSPEVLYDFDKGKCASYAKSCKVRNFSKVTLLKPIFADFRSTRPFDALFEHIKALYSTQSTLDTLN